MSASRKPLDFFREKKPWSLQKDRILAAYIQPYLQKVSRRPGLPILVVDGFAGPGVFRSGELGSPRILADAIKASTVAPSPRLLAIESNRALSDELTRNLAPFDFAQVRSACFDDVVPVIRDEATRCSTFLFLDPFAIAGLTWSSLAELLGLIHSDRLSVEVLLNFNAHAFVRVGRAAMALAVGSDSDDERGRRGRPSASKSSRAYGGATAGPRG